MNVNQNNVFGPNNHIATNKIIWKARGEGIIIGIIISVVGSLIWEIIKNIL